MSKISVGMTTVAKRNDAERIAKILTERRLAACVTIIPGVISHYRWQNKKCRDREFLLVIKAPKSKMKLIEKVLESLHPYDVPEFIYWVIDGGDRRYREWVLNC